MSNPIAWTDVTNVCNGDPIITNFNTAGTVAILATINTMLDVSMFDGESGPRTKLARCFLAAHIAASSALGMGGPLMAEADGRLSRQYAVPRVDDDLRRTSYGAMYAMLIGPQAHGPRLL